MYFILQWNLWYKKIKIPSQNKLSKLEYIFKTFEYFIQVFLLCFLNLQIQNCYLTLFLSFMNKKIFKFFYQLIYFSTNKQLPKRKKMSVIFKYLHFFIFKFKLFGFFSIEGLGILLLYNLWYCININIHIYTMIESNNL